MISIINIIIIISSSNSSSSSRCSCSWVAVVVIVVVAVVAAIVVVVVSVGRAIKSRWKKETSNNDIKGINFRFLTSASDLKLHFH